MIVITATVEIRPEHWAEAQSLAEAHSVRSRKEPGCLSHDWYPHPSRDHTLFFYEQWEDRAAIDQHFAVPDSGAFVRGLMACKAGEVVLRMQTVGSVEERRLG